MRQLSNFINEKLKVNNYNKKKENDETVFTSADGNIKIEYATEDTSNNIIRIIYKDKKMVKYWFENDILQTSLLPESCDIINEYNKIFK